MRCEEDSTCLATFYTLFQLNRAARPDTFKLESHLTQSGRTICMYSSKLQLTLEVGCCHLATLHSFHQLIYSWVLCHSYMTIITWHHHGQQKIINRNSLFCCSASAGLHSTCCITDHTCLKVKGVQTLQDTYKKSRTPGANMRVTSH